MNFQEACKSTAVGLLSTCPVQGIVLVTGGQNKANSSVFTDLTPLFLWSPLHGEPAMFIDPFKCQEVCHVNLSGHIREASTEIEGQVAAP